MSEQQPLLPGLSQGARIQHDLFPRLIESPWPFISSKYLSAIRWLIFAYNMGVWCGALVQKIRSGENSLLFLFHFGTVSLSMQLVYYGLTAV